MGRSRIATFESVIVLATASRLDVALIEQLDDLHERLRAKYPSGVSVLIVRDPDSEPLVRRGLDPAVRERGAELIKKNGRFLKACAYVFDDQGFFSAMLRMALAGMSMIAPFNARFYARTDDAIDWICGLPGQSRAVRDGRVELLALAESLSVKLRLAV